MWDLVEYDRCIRICRASSAVFESDKQAQTNHTNRIPSLILPLLSLSETDNLQHGQVVGIILVPGFLFLQKVTGLRNSLQESLLLGKLVMPLVDVTTYRGAMSHPGVHHHSIRLTVDLCTKQA